LRAAVAWARDRLTANDCDYLAALPATLRVTVGQLDLFCFHGSPRANTDSVLPTTPAAELDRLLADVLAARVFASGHTHLQMLRSHRALLLVNPGSVGLPLTALSAGNPPVPTWAEYAIVTVGADELEILYRRLPVDSTRWRQRWRGCRTRAGRAISRPGSRAETPARETRRITTACARSLPTATTGRACAASARSARAALPLRFLAGEQNIELRLAKK
jgi:predicted phosphodiesterase